MRLGFALPQVGSVAGPDALVTVAKRAEDLDYDSLSILDRMLWPINPRAPYPIGDGSLPVQYKKVLDPMETLTFAAAHTSRIALGTGGSQPSLVQSGLTGAPVDDPRYPGRRSAAGRIRHWMVTG